MVSHASPPVARNVLPELPVSPHLSVHVQAPRLEAEVVSEALVTDKSHTDQGRFGVLLEVRGVIG